MKKIYDTVRLTIKSFDDIELHDYYTILQDNSDKLVDFNKANDDFKKVIHSDSIYAICLKTTTHAIGLIYVSEVKKGYFEVGYLMNSNYKDCGYATEALQAITNDLENDGNNYVIGAIKNTDVKPFKLLANENYINFKDLHKVYAYFKD